MFPWGKKSYFLPQVTNGYSRFSKTFFQAKMSELMVALKFIRTWLDDRLCITKASLDDHLNHLRLVLTRLREVGLRVNAPKSTFCTVEMKYLGYILTRTGIEPQPKKVQAILVITPPKQVKDLRRFLDTVLSYRDLWARRSEMLAPLTSLVGECGHTKVTRAKKTKKKAWHWDEVNQIAFDNVKATIARCSTGLPTLFARIWDMHWRLV